MMRLILMCLTLFACGAVAWGESLIWERFENRTEGTVRGRVGFAADVVGYGGIGLENEYSALFDGQANSGVDHGTAKKIASTDFTVEAFVKLSRGWVYQAIAADWNEQGNNRCWALMVTPGRGLRFDVSPDGAFHPGNRLLTPPRLIQCGKWYHVAAVSQGDTSRIYINGRKVAETTRDAEGIFIDDTAHLKIGNVDAYATSRPKPLFGQLDEVRITCRAVSPSDFLQTEEPMPAATGPTPDSYAMPFAATTKQAATAWQQQARKRLFELVEAQEPRRSTRDVPIDLKLGPAEDRGEYTLYPVTFGGNKPGERYSARLCIPKGDGPFPAMLCLHGHGGSAEEVFDPAECYHGFADRFARGGYVVLAPSFPHRPYASVTLWNLFRCVDILASRPEVDPQRIGVGGLSMGGEWTMWIAACDTRLKAAVVSGWMCTTEGVFSVYNCPCWELPGFVELMDVCEVNLLIAPRPVVFESATLDGCFPVNHTKQGFARIRAGYKLFDAGAAAVHDVFPGVHEWHGKVSFPRVNQALGGHAAKSN